jgi:hypothetical protein
MRGKEDYLVTIIWRVNHVPPYENTPAHFAVFFGAARRNQRLPVSVGDCFSGHFANPPNAVTVESDDNCIARLHLLYRVSGASPGVFV